MSVTVNLGALGPFMKAIAPALLTLIGAGTNALISGKVDQQTLVIAITGLVAAIVTYLVPNAAKSTPPTPPAAPAPTPPAAAPPA